MPIHIRMKHDHEGYRAGEDLVVPGNEAKALKEEGHAWVTGGDPEDFQAFNLEACADVGPPVAYPPRDTRVEVVRGE